MNHNNVISLPVYEASSAGDILALRPDGTVWPMQATVDKEEAIGVALHDVDPYEIGDPFAIHLFSGIFIARATGTISVGDVVGIDDAENFLKNTGTIRQLGLALESLSGTGLIRVIST